MAQNNNSDVSSIATFDVKIDNVGESNFIRVSGVGIDIQDMATNTKPGAPSSHVPGGATARDITMVRHFTKDKSLYKWLDEVKKKGERVPRRTGSIVMLDTERNTVAQFDFEDAWIKSWAGPELAKDHQGNSFLQETIVVSVGDVKYV